VKLAVKRRQDQTASRREMQGIGEVDSPSGCFYCPSHRLPILQRDRRKRRQVFEKLRNLRDDVAAARSQDPLRLRQDGFGPVTSDGPKSSSDQVRLAL
jgi:hypothetical protein